MTDDSLPVLIGVGQLTDRSNDADGLAPLPLIAAAAQEALDDSGVAGLNAHIDSVAVSGLTVDAEQVSNPFSGSYKNLPKSLANRLGIKASHYLYAATGGNTPQYLVNHFAREIAAGRNQAVLLAGGEALHTLFKRFDRWYKLLLPRGEWSDKPGGKPEILGDARPGNTPHEGLYGMDFPANVYPMFENALQAHYQRDSRRHRQAIGQLFSQFSAVAADNPHAWFQQARSADELITPSPANRMIAWPYTMYLNSIIKVNQAAAVVMTSWGKAKAMGVAREHCVFLHGAADAYDHWFVTERENYHSSPALRMAGNAAMQMAGVDIDAIGHFDLYSCFPSAVQIACDELGLAHDDPRGLTLTGGLPYFGGPGNNYSMHGIVEMVNRLRANPHDYGLLNANGWYLTKHSLGIYSSRMPDANRQLLRQASIEQDRSAVPAFTEDPVGSASVETFTIVYNKRGEPDKSIIIGRTRASGERFIARSRSAPDVFAAMLNEPVIGRTGQVSRRGKHNVFEFD